MRQQLRVSLGQEIHLERVQVLLLPDAFQKQQHFETSSCRVHGNQNAPVLFLERICNQAAELTKFGRLELVVVSGSLRFVLAHVGDKDGCYSFRREGSRLQVVIGQGIDIHRIHEIVCFRFDVPYGTTDDVTSNTTTV